MIGLIILIALVAIASKILIMNFGNVKIHRIHSVIYQELKYLYQANQMGFWFRMIGIICLIKPIIVGVIILYLYKIVKMFVR